ncbi:alpha-(1,6)-fucosyltransferase-like [Amblyomma americanum]
MSWPHVFCATMFLKNRCFIKLVQPFALLTLLGLLWLVFSEFSRQSIRFKKFPHTAPRLPEPLTFQNSSEAYAVACTGAGRPCTAGKFFDATMLTGNEERHMERLARLEADIAGMRDFLELNLRASRGINKTRLNTTLAKAREYLRVMEADIAVIKTTHPTVRKSMKNMRKLRNYVLETIQRLQNPSDCESAPKLLCLLDNQFGLASAVHDVLWCFVAALQMGRTVVLNSTLWSYAPGDDGWTRTFQPLAGPACDGVDTENAIVRGDDHGRDHGIKYRSKIIDLPASIVKILVANHADPYAWWYGQIVSYILRLQNTTRLAIEDFKKNSGYKHPIVGIHIRRTDKKREAIYHAVSEYMHHAEEFYNRLTLKGETIERRVFVATDDPAVIEEIKSKFPGYKVISNQKSARHAFDLKARRQSSALNGALTDIFLLAESDQLVCGLSSGFCRVAYELMQAWSAEAGIDATRKAVSVDIEFFYAFVPFPPRRTLYSNEGIFENELHWSSAGVLLEKSNDYPAIHEARHKKYADGFNTGRIVGSSADGNRMVFPRFKTVQTYSVAQYAAFNSTRP